MLNLPLLATICFIAMIAPGPDLVLVTRNSVTLPKKQALLTAFGIISGCLVHSCYCVLGLAVIISQSAQLYMTIKLFGAGYLVYIGIKGFFTKPNSALAENFISTTSGSNISSLQAYYQGLLCNLLNPKLALFLLSLFTQFVPLEASFFDKVGVAGIFFIENLFYWPVYVLFLQSSVVSQLLFKFQFIIDRLCGGLLVALGLKVALMDS